MRVVDNMISLWGAAGWAISATFMARVIAKKGGILNCYGKEKGRDQKMRGENSFEGGEGNVQVVNS